MITKELHAQLREQYNPDGSELRKAQLRMLDMLKYIDKVCREQHIDYWLDSGTLLGAARHGGFIPWDDDTDIGLLRKDYKRLKAYLLSHPHEQYVLQCEETDPGYLGDWMVLRDLKSEYIQDSVLHNYRKYRGLQVDIFPFSVGVNYYIQRCVSKLQTLNCSLIHKKHFAIARAIHFGVRYLILPLLLAFDKLIGNKKRLSYSYSIFYNTLPTACLLPLSEIEFEGVDLKAPKDIGAYLTALYGDKWDEMPDKQLIVNHNTTVKFYD